MDSNPGFRSKFCITTSYATVAVSRLDSRNWLLYNSSAESWIRTPQIKSPDFIQKILQDSHQERKKDQQRGKTIVIVKTPGFQMVSLAAAAGEGGEVRGGGRGESAEGECDRSRYWSQLHQRSREGSAVIEALQISPRGWSKSPSSASSGRIWAR